MEALHHKLSGSDYIEIFEGDRSGNRNPRQTPFKLYSLATPTPVPDPQLIGWSEDLAKELGLRSPDGEDIQLLSGNAMPPGTLPFAMNYAGHQFGNWAGQLGDGRAINLGKISSQKASYEVQLKGAGPTAYSRHADGSAVLRSSVREFLISEAMHYLGVPTTRALALISTGEKVLRDMFYNGNPQQEQGAIVTRLAPSFLRFGSFELLAAQRDKTQLLRLVNWTISTYFPGITGEDKILSWYQQVVQSTAALMTQWHRIGFVHGVMNTDNMSIHGLSLDFGPFSFLDNYDLNFTPNTTDLPGRRYAFGNQASVAYWNLGKLANAISLLFEDTDDLKVILESYEDEYWKSYYRMMGNKLGLGESITPEDQVLISKFEKLLSDLQPDMTLFYRMLLKLTPDSGPTEIRTYFDHTFYRQLEPTEQQDLNQLLLSYIARRKEDELPWELSQELMGRNNPRIILRNYLLHQAIAELEEGKDQLFKKLQVAMKDPYRDEGFEELVQKRPEWAASKPGCSMLSCSS